MRKVEETTEWLEGRIRAGEWPPDGIIPSVRALAAELGCSPPTAHKVILSLEAAHLIRIHKIGHQRTTHSVGDIETSSHDVGPRYIRLAARIRSEIAAGTLDFAGVLPIRKELCARFRCHHATLGRALALLLRAGVIVERKQQLLLAETAVISPNSTRYCLFLTRGALRSFDALNIRALIDALEGVIFTWTGRSLITEFVDTPRAITTPRHLIAGYIHIAGGNTEELGWKNFLRSITDLPVVVIDLSGANNWTMQKSHRYYKVRPDFHSAFAEVGRHLRSLGHRRVAFLTHVSPGVQWVKERLDGLGQALGSPLGIESSALSPGLWVRLIDYSTVRQPPKRRIRDKKLDTRVPGAIAARISYMVERGNSTAELADAARNVFRTTIDAPAVTAWVCLNDALALAAMDFVQQERRIVAADLSIVGCDNIPEALETGLTTVAYDPKVAANAVLRCLQGTPLLERRHDGLVLFPCVLKSRRSVGPARPAPLNH